MRRYMVLLMILSGCAGGVGPPSAVERDETMLPVQSTPAVEAELEAAATSIPAPFAPPAADQPTSTAVALQVPPAEPLAEQANLPDISIIPAPVGAGLLQQLEQLDQHTFFVAGAPQSGLLKLVNGQGDVIADPVADLIEQGRCDAQPASDPYGNWSPAGRFMVIGCDAPGSDVTLGLALLDLASATWLFPDTELQVFAGGWQQEQLLVQLEQSKADQTVQTAYALWSPVAGTWSALPIQPLALSMTAWSPDGSLLAALEPSPEHLQLVVVDPAAATVQRYPFDATIAYGFLAWHPNGKQVLLNRLREGTDLFEYAVLDLNSGTINTLATWRNDGTQTPTYRMSSDGRLFVLQTDAGWQVFDAANMLVQTFAAAALQVSLVAWDPDSTALVLSGLNDAASPHATEVWRYELDGTTTQLASLPNVAPLSLDVHAQGTIAVSLSNSSVVLLDQQGRELAQVEGTLMSWR